MESSAQPGDQLEADLAQALDRLWLRFLPEIRERVGILEAAAAAVGAQKLSRADCEAAQSAAHKLAGVLGTFNLTRGTVLAREAEILFTRDEIGGEDAARLQTIAGEIRMIVEGRGGAS